MLLFSLSVVKVVLASHGPAPKIPSFWLLAAVDQILQFAQVPMGNCLQIASGASVRSMYCLSMWTTALEGYQRLGYIHFSPCCVMNQTVSRFQGR